ncbi:MAG: hypothetical protein IPF96_21175 [Rhodobacter sp.]|nr:hypothetical protein [Rhodobacter sp.]
MRLITWPTTAILGVFEFDLSTIADDSTILSAAFGFTLGVGSFSFYSPIEFTVDAYLGNGVVDVADFTALGSTVITSSVVSGLAAGTTLSFDLSSLVPLQGALAGNLLTLRLSLTNQEQLNIAAIENTAYGNATLTLDAEAAPPPSPVPLPAGLPLLLAGLGALGPAAPPQTLSLRLADRPWNGPAR